MRPITIVLLAAALAVGIGTYALTWFTQKAGTNTIKLRPTEISVCSPDGACTKQNSDGADYDSTWLGVTNAGKITGGLGLLAFAAAAAMAHSRKTQLGSGGVAIKKQHLLIAAAIGLGLTGASLLIAPMGLQSAPGVFVALAGYAAGTLGVFMLTDEPAPNPRVRLC
ncbi:MAG: hypothetical protein H0T42_07030 [Deltaproteobacteria bacterium]|nr:hypothetical protein [Deltaproteobacteria bacterium]